MLKLNGSGAIQAVKMADMSNSLYKYTEGGQPSNGQLFVKFYQR